MNVIPEADRGTMIVVHDDAQCADLVGMFSQFFVDKVRRIRDSITSALHQSSPRVFAARPHTGPELSAFQPVTIDEVRKLLTSISRKTSPLDVLPVSSEGLRGRLCTGYHHTRQLVTADRAVSSTFQVSASAAAAKEGGTRPIVAGQVQTYIELIDSLQGARETCAGTPAISPHQLHELQQAAVSTQARTLNGDGTGRCP